MSNKINLIEVIKKNEIGTGFLIENDGFIEHNPDKLDESIKSEQSNKWHIPYPFIVPAVFQKWGIRNANGRIYGEKILKREVDKYINTKIKERSAYGECNHPPETVIDAERLSHNIIDLQWQNQTLIGTMEILITPGYRMYGIASTVGDIVANHLFYNKLKLGVSSRGIGSVKKEFGTFIVGDDYELLCWDIVTDPSTPNAWIGKTPEDISMYIENKTYDNNIKLIENKIEKLNNIIFS